MRTLKKKEKYILAIVIAAITVFACILPSTFVDPNVVYTAAVQTVQAQSTQAVLRITPTLSPITPILPVLVTPLQTLATGFAQIDQALKESIIGSIAYNKPPYMKLNETATIELLLNPSAKPSELATQITESGQVQTASIQITPRMKVVLIPENEDAFSVKPLHDNPEQLISTIETTKWSWYVTAKKGGMQRLTLVIYRLIKIDGVDNWRLIESYQSDIVVEVTVAQRILMIDWKWIAGFIIALVGSVLGVLNYLSNRKKKKK